MITCTWRLLWIVQNSKASFQIDGSGRDKVIGTKEMDQAGIIPTDQGIYFLDTQFFKTNSGIPEGFCNAGHMITVSGQNKQVVAESVQIDQLISQMLWCFPDPDLEGKPHHMSFCPTAYGSGDIGHDRRNMPVGNDKSIQVWQIGLHGIDGSFQIFDGCIGNQGNFIKGA
jgi:hypothetical protein